MVTTTFAAVALSTVLTAGSVSTPKWQTDYSKAVTFAAAQHKPLAVFIGRGEGGYAEVVGGEVPAEAGQVLVESYICMYVDTDTVAGKSLANEFALTKGLVISGKDGNVQALRYAGTVAPTELTGYLTRFSNPNQAISTTEKAGEFLGVPAAPTFAGCPNGRCGISNPAMGLAPSYVPQGYTNYPAFSSCPNGRCPNAR